MSEKQTADFDRWEELQAIQVLFGLTWEEQEEYKKLASRSNKENHNAFEMIVASLDVAWSQSDREPLPSHLVSLIQRQAREELLGAKQLLDPPINVRSTNSKRYNALATWIVAAATIALTVMYFFAHLPTENLSLTLARQRSALIANSKDLIQASWTDGTTPIAGVQGDVAWSSQQQQGFMRFRGLTVNEPTIEQYQLWIFDKTQSDKTPIDGGVFDIPVTGEVIVPIHAKLPVREVYMFAVTIEKPGGVAVSSRERLPLLAKVE